MNIRDFQKANVERCQSGSIIEGKPVGGFARRIDEWTLERWHCATSGELGEAANVVKKLFRGFDLTTGKDAAQLREQLGHELADVFAYLVLFAEAAGVDLEAAAIAKFNEVNARIGYDKALTGGGGLLSEQEVRDTLGVLGVAPAAVDAAVARAKRAVSL